MWFDSTYSIPSNGAGREESAEEMMHGWTEDGLVSRHRLGIASQWQGADNIKEDNDMTNRVRIYGKELNTWTSFDERGRECIQQIEYAYRDYDEDGLLQTGSEDFGNERRRNLKRAYVWIWDGLSKNRGGFRRWDRQDYIRFYADTKKKDIEEVFKKMYGVDYVDIRVI